MIVQPASLGPRSRPRRALRVVGIVVPVVLLVAVAAAGALGPAPTPPPVVASDDPAIAVADPTITPVVSPPAGPAEAPAAAVFPSTMAGLDVHGLRWTATARNRGLARGVVAVAGYLGLDAIPDDCRDTRLGVFGPFCTRIAVLAEAPWYGATNSGPDTPGFHLHPQFPVGVRMPSQSAFVAISPSTRTPPVVLLGRFGDDRAERCVPGGRHCGQEFVVERVAWVDGIEYPTTATVDPLADDAGLTLADLRRDATIASATLPASSYPLLEVLVRPATIARIDPAIAAATDALAPDAAVWLVRGLHARGDPTQIDWRIVARDGGRVIASGSIKTTRSPGAG